MNKAELVAHVAKESELSKDAAEKAVDATFKNIEKALRGGDTVRIVGFGNFQAGYLIGDRVLRPALVAIAKAGSKAEPSATDNSGSVA